ncbi:D-2-hydroxyacid dehydrogenase [candidate division KSB1 bacterium]|nr:D-2-hydroxyacid dehydrogenase [candidate division KSB1 bacterium]
MRIVVLDGYTLNPGDLSWAELEALGECAIYDRTPVELVFSRSVDTEILLTNKTVIQKQLIDQLPALKYIGVLATGYNVVDINAAAARGIPVTNVPTYGTDSVVQMVFAHLLHFCRRIAEHSAGVRESRWTNSNDFCYWDYPLIEITDLTMGIVGLGRIGTAVAHIASAFGMKVIAYDPMVTISEMTDVEMTDLQSLFRISDVVSLHCPLTRENQSFVNDELLGLMKPTTFLINTSRGQLIDESALADALNNSIIAGAGLDVLVTEPPASDNPLLTARNCFITPHIAWATRAARSRLMNTATANVKAFLRGELVNVVNGI